MSVESFSEQVAYTALMTDLASAAEQKNPTIRILRETKPHRLEFDREATKTVFMNNLKIITGDDKLDWDDQSLLWFIHNLIELSRNYTKQNYKLIFPRDKPKLWRDWLQVINTLLNVFTYKHDPINNHAIKSYFSGFTGFDNKQWMEYVSKSEELMPEFRRIFGAEGLGWFSE